MRLLLRLAGSVAAAVVVGIFVAIVVTVLDLYLTGHGYGSIRRQFVSWTQLSVGDIGMLVAAFAAAAVVWWVSSPARKMK